VAAAAWGHFSWGREIQLFSSRLTRCLSARCLKLFHSQNNHSSALIIFNLTNLSMRGTTWNVLIELCSNFDMKLDMKNILCKASDSLSAISSYTYDRQFLCLSILGGQIQLQ
jgi:hypothetical protein